MGRFGKEVSQTSTKRKSTAHHAKAEIRRNVMAEIDAPRVFDAFAGSGGMYRSVWHEADGYAGCDLEWHPDERLAFVADNRRVMRAIDLRAFNLFDLDAFGSPWEQVYILARRRPVAPGERLGLILTEGSSMKVRLGGMAKALQHLAGIAAPLPGMSKAHDETIERALLNVCGMMGCRLARRWMARQSTGMHMRYIGLVLEGQDPVTT